MFALSAAYILIWIIIIIIIVLFLTGEASAKARTISGKCSPEHMRIGTALMN